MRPEVKAEAPWAHWRAYFREFNRRNLARPTRLGVVKTVNSMEDTWIEDGLPLGGVDLNGESSNAPSVEIMLGREGASEESMTHTIPGVRMVSIRLSADGTQDGLDIEDEKGAATLLRFEQGAVK